MLDLVTAAARGAALIAATLMLFGCETLALTTLGIGGSAAVNHQMANTPSRTFTAPLTRVKNASIDALRRMGIEAGEVKKVDTGEVITARAGNREIEVELESLTAQTTRMRVVARDGSFFFHDGATAAEIIAQTQKSLGV
ncbi:MAG TPA: hypothetical protein VGF58_02840 [Burkholderiales bacterium]|jgi:hypothetical protein